MVSFGKAVQGEMTPKPGLAGGYRTTMSRWFEDNQDSEEWPEAGGRGPGRRPGCHGFGCPKGTVKTSAFFERADLKDGFPGLDGSEGVRHA